MDIENLIKDTFTAHEHVAPDGDAVLAGARQRIEARRAVLTRPIAVAAGVVALTLAAVTAVVVNRSGTTPGDTTQVGAPGIEATGPESGAIADLTMPYSLDWLPPGEVEYLARRINTGATAADPDTPLFGGEYMLKITAGGQVLAVDVQQMRMMPVDDAAFKSGPGAPVTVNGQRGVESAHPDGAGGYELYVTHPDGGSMYVSVAADHGSTVPAQQLVEAGRRIAENIRFPGTATVTPVFGLRDLPAETRVCTFEVDRGFSPTQRGQGAGTSYSLGTCAEMPPIHVTTDTGNEPAGTAGRSVQGHETRHAERNDFHTLWVLDAVGDAPVTISGNVPLTDLYEVADHLVLPR
jgi:hypothetical protein